MPLTRGGRNTNAAAAAAADVESPAIDSSSSASPSLNSSKSATTTSVVQRKQRFEKVTLKKAADAAEVPKTEEQSSNECEQLSKGKQTWEQVEESPSSVVEGSVEQRESRRTRHMTSTDVANTLSTPQQSAETRSSRKRGVVSESTTAQTTPPAQQNNDSMEKQHKENNDERQEEAKQETPNKDIEIKVEVNEEKEEHTLSIRTSSRQRKPTARYYEMLETEKRFKHQRHERGTSRSAEKRRLVNDEEDSGEVVVDVMNETDGSSSSSSNVAVKKVRTISQTSTTSSIGSSKTKSEQQRHTTIVKQRAVIDTVNDQIGTPLMPTDDAMRVDEQQQQQYEETVIVDELDGSFDADVHRIDYGSSMVAAGMVERRNRVTDRPYVGGNALSVASKTKQKNTAPPAISSSSSTPLSMENAIPATAPLLTTDRTKIRHVKRNKPEDREIKEATERVSTTMERRRYTNDNNERISSSTMHQPRIVDRHTDVTTQQQRSSYRPSYYAPRSPRRSMTIREEGSTIGSTYQYTSTRVPAYREDTRASRYVENMDRQEEFIPQGQQIIINEDGEEMIYEPIEVGDEEEIIEEQIGDGDVDDDGETLIFTEADLGIEEEVVEAAIEEAQHNTTQHSSIHRRQGGSLEGTANNATLIMKEDVTDDGGEGEEVQQEGGDGDENDGEDDESPPHLDPEQAPPSEEVLQMESLGRAPETEYIEGMGEVIRVESPGGTQQFIQVNAAQQIDDETFYIDENGMLIEEPSQQQDLRAVEFNFLDNKNICCGLCGEIVPYDLLMSEHLPNQHPEVLGDGGSMDFEEIPYEVWLRDKLSSEKKHMENGFRSAAYDPYRMSRSTRVLRRVSQVRVNPNEMTLAQLDNALRKKMIEKMGRKVPVTLVDKQHARCGICNAVVSLNRKFEVVHLVRHFNAWHPSAHRCAATWKDRQPQPGNGKPLSTQDFAVIDTSLDVGDNLQCIWCGMFMDTDALAMHFSEVHPDEVEVPKCNLCLQELVINARLTEKYGEDFGVSLPDEHHIRCAKFETIHNSEAALDKLIEKRLRRLQTGNDATADSFMSDDGDDDEEEEQSFGAGPEAYLNSRMSFGRRSKPKRHFIMPALRQAAPIGSKYVEPVTECHWRCKLCKADILAAVISAGAIRHFRTTHPDELEQMQYELCKARLERVSDGCMEFVHPQLIECLVCNMTYALHKPFNMCRAIRHLKSKHPDMMPEYAGIREQLKSSKQKKQGVLEQPSTGTRNVDLGERIDENGFITDPETIAMLRAQYGVDFEKVQALEGADGERVYVLMGAGEEIDAETAQQLAASISSGDIVSNVDNSQQPSTSQQIECKTSQEDEEQHSMITEEIVTETDTQQQQQHSTEEKEKCRLPKTEPQQQQQQQQQEQQSEEGESQIIDEGEPEKYTETELGGEQECH